MRYKVATIRHLMQTAAAHFQLCAQRVEGFTDAVGAGIIDVLSLGLYLGGTVGAVPFVTGAAHRAAPGNQRLGMANQIRSAIDCSAAFTSPPRPPAVRSSYRPRPSRKP